jgi:Ran GTPase-activating protein (RanGAP) involved in mRNA processing and transport
MHLLPSLSKLPLLHLKLSHNKLGDAGVTVMSQHLSAVSCLTLLDISRNYCSSIGAEELGAALHGLPSLRVLDVSGNRVCAIFVEVLVPHLSSLPDLREFSIAACRQNGPGFGNRGASLLAAAMAAVPKLESLNLEFNRIGVIGCTALAQCMTVLQSLQVLRLGRNRLGPGPSITALAESFASLTSLKELNLQGA